MDKSEITRLLAAFEALVRNIEGVEYWFARELQPLLEYSQWRNFKLVLDKAKEASRGAGQRVEDHFADVSNMVDLGSGAQRAVEDVALTRYACYLIAQNADPRKAPVAFAQTYFALQTRKQELIEARLVETERLEARARLAASEKELSGLLYERLADEQCFARIRSRGDAALFGGKNTRQMKARLRVPTARPLADFLPTITIKTKDLANEMTTHRVRDRDLRHEPTISAEHVANNRVLRGALGKRGIRPEELPAAEDVLKLERRLRSEERRLLEDPARKARGSGREQED